VDAEKSSERPEVVARVCRGARQYTVALVDLAAPQKDTKTGEWLAAYRNWPGK
jgi:hypothetical protein